MKYKITLLFSLFICIACHNTSNNQPQAREKSEYQEQLMRDGWTLETLSDLELGEEYGVKPVYVFKTIISTLQWEKVIMWL